jgi:hypothetical protein
MLHAVWSLASGGVEEGFLRVLGHLRREDASVEHHVLALAGGPLEAGFRQAAHAVTIGCDRQTIERQLSAPYDLAHLLCERCADRLLPELVSRSATPVAYGKGCAPAGAHHLEEGFPRRAEEAMLAACDAATFMTARLALRYDLAAAHTTILGDVAELAQSPAGSDSDPVRIVARRLLQALRGACGAGPYWRVVD